MRDPRTHDIVDDRGGRPPVSRGRPRRWARDAGLVAIAALAALPAAAEGAARVYWTNDAGNSIGFANLAGEGAGNVPIGGATLSGPQGMAIDPAAGRLYWANYDGNKISFANLDGTGGGDLRTAGATVASPYGVAIDPAGGRIYWANAPGGGGSRISFAALDGSGGGDLNTAGATALSNPLGVAVDPAGGRVYWANYGAGKISFARLDGSGGADIPTAGATVNGPAGVALDPGTGRIYWANLNGDTISFAALDGTGGGDLPTAGATVNDPEGVAIDPEARTVYWANYGAPAISFARLDGSGGGNVVTTGATVSEAGFPALLVPPAAAGAPAITGAGPPGSVLSCTAGSWAPDVSGAFLYRAPRALQHRWSRDGAEIAGATAPTYIALAAGEYRCIVSASNAAGEASQTSTPVRVQPSPPRTFGPRTLVALRLAPSRIGPRGPVRLVVLNRNPFPVRGRITGTTVRRLTPGPRARRVALRPARFRLEAGARATVAVALPRALRRPFARAGRLPLRLSMRLTDPAGVARSVRATVVPRLRPAPPRDGRLPPA